MVLFWVVILAAAALLEGAVRTRALSPAIYAAPSAIFLAFGDLALHRDLLHHVMATLGRTLAGFGIGGALGALVAAALFAAPPRTRRSAESLVDVLRSIPATALLPLFIAIFGIGDANKIAVGASAALFIVAVGLHAGLRAAAARFSVVTALYQPSGRTRWLLLLGPAVLHSAIATSRLALSACLVLVVVSEMFIGSRSGIGYLINDLQYGDNRAGQYAAVLASGAVGYLLNAVLGFARRAVIARGIDG